ncbi:MAG: NPXTG-anchored protein, partial [Ruminococcus sp.]|nr:NPXTG-anchored protein [Ruminococcus sp.]
AKIRLGEGAEILSTSTDSMLVWKSGETPTTIMGISDGTYVLKETAAPDGYLVATDITFVVENGIVTESSSTITSQNVITMTDEAIDTTETSETTSTTTTETTTETTSTTAPSTASSSDSPRTGSTGVGAVLGLMALSAMTAFVLRKKDDENE